MRAFVFLVTAACLAIGAAPVACANVVIAVDKNTQQMSVSVDGVPRYRWAVSTGRAGYGTPSGTYHPQRLEKTWFSKLYYNSPMPHSIFFHGGYAIHGTEDLRHLGHAASHGCVRLDPQNAKLLYDLVSDVGMKNVKIVLHG
jgi:lipoprotein-anchoring transpeptidase ErfK/SrfK